MLSDVTFSHFCIDNHEYKIMAPRVDLPLLKKVELIKDYDRKFSQRDLAIKYKISTGAVCNILKRKQEYLNDFESNQCHEIRRKIKNNLRKKINEETSPKIYETIEMVRRLRLFSITQSPQLHQAIIGIQSMLTDIYLDSQTSVQSTLDSYFKIT